MIEPPLVLSDVEAADWSETADVLVVGFGGAGAVAAIEAAQRGADVLAVDSYAGGGATAWSGGVNYAGGSTRLQREGGIVDTVDAMYAYLHAEGVPVSDATLRRFCEESAGSIDWLMDLGVPYGSNPYLEKCALPPDHHFLYYSGNEKHPRFAAVARPAPRAHRVKTDGFGGPVYFAALRAAADRLGVRFRPSSPVRRLVLDGSGRTVGVEILAMNAAESAERAKLDAKVKPWAPISGAAAERAIARKQALERSAGTRQLLRGRQGVLLATGGYIYNLEMLRRLRPELADAHRALMRLGKMGCDGSGIELGASAGGQPDLMENISVGRIIAPPEALLHGLIVNTDGDRFVNEDAYVCTLGDRLAVQAASRRKVWLILNARDFRAAFRQAVRPGKGLFKFFGLPVLLNMILGGTKRAATLDGLARKCRIDPVRLEQTVAQFNAGVRDGVADPLGKSKDYGVAIDDHSYFALNMDIGNLYSFVTAFSLGGLRVDEQTGGVLRADGEAIPGLYAAGRAAVGLCSLSYMSSGMAIADTVFSGRRAGRAMAGGQNPAHAVRSAPAD